MCRIKKEEEPIVIGAKATNQPQKGQKNSVYACHIYGLNGHKMTDCPKFAKMQKMFQGKNASNLEGKAIVEVKTITTNVNVIDVNVVTRSRIIKKQIFLEIGPRKNKTTVDWEEEKLKKTMVETISQLQKTQATNEGSSASIERWNKMWPGMFNITPSIEPQKP